MSTPNGPYDPYSPQDSQQQPYGQQAPYGQQQQPYASYPGGTYGSQPGYSAPGGPDGYLSGGPVGFGDAIKLAFSNAFVYQGRASRSAYWWFALFAFIVYLIVDIIFLQAIGGGFGAAIYALVALAGVVVTLPLGVRRLHDTNRSGFWLFIGLIPIIGSIVLLVFCCLPGTPGPNRFG
jgi:uncharacterized membrane protein YhaH (DUF805 family)